MGIKVDVYGVRETLAELRKYDAVKPLSAYQKRSEVIRKTCCCCCGSKFPDEPLMNWHTSGGRRKGKSNLPPYNGFSAKRKSEGRCQHKKTKRNETSMG
jgi:hypothetical protein